MKYGETILSKAEFDQLPEYSCSLPTGQQIGKRWKARAGRRDWMIGEYYDIGSETKIGIRWTWAIAENLEPYRQFH